MCGSEARIANAINITTPITPATPAILKRFFIAIPPIQNPAPITFDI
jgi:hypothetical protein